MKLYNALGLMSGTSMDGIDVALIDTDGEERVEHRAFRSFPYGRDMRARLAAAMATAQGLDWSLPMPEDLAALERDLTLRHAEAIAQFLHAFGIDGSTIDIVGFHGQTLVHRPEQRLTVQLGDGQLLADETGSEVVSDLRSADIAAGGQGAPLAPVYHRALAAALDERPVAFVNIGGVANVTWIGTEELIAFDTGPGNALLDDWTMMHLGQAHDEGGALASSGIAEEAVVSHYLSHPYVQASPPKSLDRGDFTLEPVRGMSPADGAATLTLLTVKSIAQSATLVPAAPRRWIICGGGRHNGFLMKRLRAALAAPVLVAEDLGLNGDAIEAEAWAYMAVRSAKGLPITCPGTTGVPAPLSGGRSHRPALPAATRKAAAR